MNLSLNCETLSIEDGTAPHCVMVNLKNIPHEEVISFVSEIDDLKGLLDAIHNKYENAISDYVIANSIKIETNF